MTSPEQWMPENITYNTEPEYLVVSYLNLALRQIAQKLGRPNTLKAERNDDKYGPDILIFAFDYETNTQKNRICAIEVEVKQNSPYIFDEYPNGLSPRRNIYWSFLDRKISNEAFQDIDIYALCHPAIKNPDSSQSKQMFWVSFGKIRNDCTLFQRSNNRHEKYWRKYMGQEKFCRSGYHSLAKHLLLKEYKKCQQTLF